MKKLAAFIVKFRWVLTGLLVAIVAVCAVFMTKVNTNYDIIKYLDKNSETVLALDKMQEEFGAVGSANLMVKNIGEDDAEKLYEELSATPGVANVLFEKSDGNYYDKEAQCALYVVFLKDANFSPEGHATVENIRKLLTDEGRDLAMSGQSLDSIYLQGAVKKDMVIILAISAAVIFLILLITSSSWIDPVIFAIIVVAAILINLGTNALLPEISFITKSICAVMQLALAMDYSIMLLHRFNEEKQTATNKKEAITNALAKTFAPVSASSLTTVAGLAALMFMSFTLGFDIGLVLAKGVLISLISVFLFMPGLIYLFAPLIEKTKHRTLQSVIHDKITNRKTIEVENSSGNAAAKKKRRIRSFADFQFSTRIIIPVILVVLIVLGFVGQRFCSYNYKLETAKNQSDPVITERADIEKTFGYQNSLVVVFPKDTSDENGEKEKAFTATLSDLDVDGRTVISKTDAKKKRVMQGGYGMANTGLRTLYSAAELAEDYGLPEEMVAKAIGLINSSKKTTENDSEEDSKVEKISLGELIEWIDLISGIYEEYTATEAAKFMSALFTKSLNEETNVPVFAVSKVYNSMHETGKVPFKKYVRFCYEGEVYKDPLTAHLQYGINQLVQLFENLPEEQLNEITSNPDFELGAMAIKTFDSEKYTRLLFNLDMPIAEDSTFAFIEGLRETVKEYYDEVYVVCESASFLDIRDAFNSDMVKVNLISFFAVLLIVLITYRSIGIPVILTLVIQGTVWISAGLSIIGGSSLFFICSLIVMCIQMGATIDYAILLTSRYTEYRKTLDRKTAIKEAFNSSIVTILTSGAILVLASFIIGLVSNVALISELGLLLARGCLISVLVIVFALPQILLLCDKILEKTTLKCKFFNETLAPETTETHNTKAIEAAETGSVERIEPAEAYGTEEIEAAATAEEADDGGSDNNE